MKIKKILAVSTLGLTLFGGSQMTTAEKASADGVFGDSVEKLERAVRILQNNFTRYRRQVAYSRTWPDAPWGKKTLTAEYYNMAVSHQSMAYVRRGGRTYSGWYPAGYKVWTSSRGDYFDPIDWGFYAQGNRW
ncbi:hypothetical protein [Lactococcus petauri]|uniref:hypothetical protein n=1 Tax=Lactococcus petauri TaxID=1940789 RepID=UPI0022E35338|nr:hypothetical protein [Lactococcus petauri]